MGHFWKYHSKLFKRAWRDAFSRMGFGDMNIPSLIQAFLLWLASSFILYVFFNKTDIVIEDAAGGIAGLAGGGLVFLLYYLWYLFWAPTKLDMEQQTEILSLRAKILDKNDRLQISKTLRGLFDRGANLSNQTGLFDLPKEVVYSWVEDVENNMRILNLPLNEIHGFSTAIVPNAMRNLPGYGQSLLEVKLAKLRLILMRCSEGITEEQNDQTNPATSSKLHT